MSLRRNHIEYNTIHAGIERATFDNFNIKEWNDVSLLEKLFYATGTVEHVVCFAMKENSYYLDSSEVRSLKGDLPELFRRVDGYYELKEQRGKNYKLHGYMNNVTISEVKTLWNLYEFICFYKVESVNRSTLSKYEYFTFSELKSLLSNRTTEVIISKLEEGVMCVEYRQDNKPSVLYDL